MEESKERHKQYKLGENAVIVGLLFMTVRVLVVFLL